MNDEEPTVDEIREAITLLRNGKAPGIDEITAEGIKAGGDVLLERLHGLIIMIWHSDQIPSRWKKAITV
ncbi:hypothetical protein, partial [Acinetobacter baumannii]|uniref:hypothetical protein n=1 Tax=Acinetobacter baumannii TaxID=470 RepID=UPI0033964498